MYSQNVNIKLTVDAIARAPDMTYGEDFTVQQLRWNLYQADHITWKCPKCRHQWTGHRKLKYEGRKPDRCPKCHGRVKVLEVKK